MWIFNKDYNKWVITEDKLTKSNFDYLKQELVSTRYYSKCLSGAAYLPINTIDNIYDILGEYEPRNWYIDSSGSQYSYTAIPQNASPINGITSNDYYTKYLSEYGLTLKNLFTPQRLIKDSIHYLYVDVSTTEQINLNTKYTNLIIDGVKLLQGHRLLVKDQISTETLPFDTDPNTYFKGNYTLVQDYGATIEYSYYNSENGIYLFNNGYLTKTSDLSLYEDCIRYSVSVKLGAINTQRQFHLSRLLNGYYPTSTLSEPVEFIEKHNWLLRNRVDYNNLFEINYYDVLKHSVATYSINSITYSIPERTIAVGEFGVILNTQAGISNIIPNKYKVNLRSITQTDLYYWVCGDDGTLLKIRKHDFIIEKISLNITKNLKSVSFYNNLKGVVVGNLNTILITNDGGVNWHSIIVDDFDSYYYNKALFQSQDKIYIIGNTGVFIELEEDISGWSAYKRRISRFIDDYEEYLLVDNINDIIYTNISWPLTYLGSTQSIVDNKEILLLVTDDGKIIANDLNSTTNFDFLYLDFLTKYNNITNIIQQGTSNNFYFSGDDGILSFDLTSFQTIGVGNTYSNTLTSTADTFYVNTFVNKLFDYKGNELLICGNTSLLESSTYGSQLNFSILDSTFVSRLKSKMLFVDYDVASKLNFFTDAGDYRLPNSVNFNFNQLANDGISLTAAKANLWFEPLVYGATAPSFMTQSETNWLTYWKDTDKTFTYYGSTYSLDEKSKVEISTTFSYIQQIPQLSFLGADNTIGQVSRLAPSILSTTSSKFNGEGLTPIAPPTSLSNLYLYDYIMIIKAPNNFPVSIGDVIRLESDVVDGNFVVNRIQDLFTSANNQFSKFVPKMYRYIYVFTNFNDNIITNLVNSTNYINITNLNIYSTINELESNFNLHPISNAYQLSYDSNINDPNITISPKFNNLTSYYNLATKVLVGDPYVFDYQNMIYTDGFLKFGYTPTYNILDYLTSLDSNKFTFDKEYYAMPSYKAIPLEGSSNATSTNIYFDYAGIDYSKGTTGSHIKPSNILQFGTDLKLEWQSIFIDTFVDIIMYSDSNYYNPATGSTHSTERALVMKKYYDSVLDKYIIEFGKSINFPIGTYPKFIDIISRRKLSQISEDLQELNNIQRPRFVNKSIIDNNHNNFYNYDRTTNYKISTDSYIKILLSDVDTIKELSAVIYTDYKNELAMNITRLAREYNIKITDTDTYNGKLLIICGEKHELKNSDGVVLEFNGGTHSSQFLNQQYFGYHSVNVIDDYKLWIDLPFNNNTIVNDTGYLKYIKSDPFFNYQPVDIIDVGVDKKGKIAIELSIDNLKLSNSIYSLVNVDYNKYRFRLIDGLNIETLSLKYPWILEAEVSGALLGLDTSGLVWYKGFWECGRWFGGTWISGTWKSGDWYAGTWNSKKITDNLISVEVDSSVSDTIQSTWFGGRWYAGTWNNGTWVDGRWYGGTWNTGNWYKGIWNDGTWNDGIMSGGVWVTGTWNGGIFNCDNDPAYWLDGKWNGGDFENGIWYNGIFEEKNSLARFGTKAYNSRTANWKSGKWLSGSFYSKMIMDNSGLPIVSTSHKYSIWKTGSWFKGDWYGGIAYNMDFQSGNWHGGILEDIQIIGISYNSSVVVDSYITLNGEFSFNIGDEINILNTFGVTNSIEGRYKVIDFETDTINKKTKLYINIPSGYNTTTDDNETGLRVVSRFRSADWKSGIWTNGIFETGLWEGGIWYNGLFKDGANWM